MKKVFTKIAWLSVGLTLAIGVGVAVGSKTPRMVRAETIDYTSIGTGSVGKETVGETEVDKITWTLGGGITATQHKAGSTTNVNTTYNTASTIRFYVKHVFSFEAASGFSIVGIKFNNSGNAQYSGGNLVASTTWDGGTSYITASDTTNLTITGANLPKDGETSIVAKSGSVSAIYFSVDKQTRPASFTISYIKPDSGAPEEILCDDQALSVTETVLLENEVSFEPLGSTCDLSYSIKSGSEFIDLSETGVLLGKKGGSAVVTITPSDTSKGAKAIDINVTVSSISPSQIEVGDKYAIYAIDDADSYNGELTGVASSKGTSASFIGTVPSCSNPFTVEAGYFENTVALKDGSSYLSFTVGSTSNALYTSSSVNAGSSWIVTWNSDTEAAVLRNAGTTGRTLQFNYNKGNPLFACYASEQKAISLHKYEEKPLSNFTIESEIDVYVSATKQIAVTYNPADATDKTLSWSSDSEDIATVNENGVVTGVAVGEAIITASKTIGGNLVEKTCTVTVLNNASTHRGTVADPFNVEDAVNVAKGVFTKDPDGNPLSATGTYYVAGLLTKAVSRTTSTLTFWVGDNASQISADTGAFEVYKAAKVYGTALADEYESSNDVVNDFPVGAHIVVVGDFTVYNGTAETNQNTADIKYCEYVAARKYAEGFNSAFEAEGVCDSDGHSTVSTLAGVWGQQATAYDALDDATKLVFKTATAKTTSSATKVEKCAAKYDYIGGKYNTQLAAEYDFMDRNPAPVSGGALSFNNLINSDSTMIIVISIAAISALGLTFALVFKKKKQR